MIDLHTHSIYSDGSFSPTELVDLAKKIGLSAVALTDHDTVGGIDEAIVAARSEIEIVPGVELSASYGGKSVHIMGLFIDHNNSDFLATLKWITQKRDERNIKILEKLNQANMPVSLAELTKEAFGDVAGKVHIANILVKKGFAKNKIHVFEKYLGSSGLMHVDRERLSAKECINIINRSKGVAVLAHPATLGLKNEKLKKLLKAFKGYGLSGIETFYPSYKANLVSKFSKLASEFNLVRSGGSDFHGINKPSISLGTGYGRLYIDDSLLIPIKNLQSHTITL